MKLFLVTGAAATTAALTVSSAFVPKIVGYKEPEKPPCGCPQDVPEAEPAAPDGETDQKEAPQATFSSSLKSSFGDSTVAKFGSNAPTAVFKGIGAMKKRESFEPLEIKPDEMPNADKVAPKEVTPVEPVPVVYEQPPIRPKIVQP